MGHLLIPEPWTENSSNSELYFEHLSDRGEGGTVRFPLKPVLLAVCVRALFVFLVKDAPLLIDMQEYHDLAVSMLSGEGYVNANGPTAFRPPLYPAFLTAVYWLTGGPYALAARFAQCLLGGLEVWFTFQMVAALGLGSAALPAAWFVALYPTRILYTTFLHREALLGILWLAQLLMFSRLASGKPGSCTLVCIGISIAGSALCNAVMVATSLALSVYYLFTNTSKRTVLCLLGAWAVAIALLVPWGYRNQQVLGSWVWINTKGGRALWEGNNPGWLEGKSEIVIRQEQWDQLSHMPEPEAERFARAKGLEFITSRPGEFLYLTWRRALQFWRLELLPFFYHKHGYWGNVPKGVLVGIGGPTILAFPLLLLMAVAGAVVGFHHRSVRLLVLLFAVHCLASSLFIGGFRYHYPLVPGFAVLAAIGWQRRHHLKQKALLIWAVISLLFTLNLVDHVAANWGQVGALLGKGGRFEHSDTRSWMKKGLF